MRKYIRSILLLGPLVGLLTASTSFAETVAERFEKAMKKKAEYCATHKIDPANRRCDITKLQPADPLATDEGRFAQSIEIPNPVPEDIGYKPGMTPQEYFDHLCKAEAGDFVFKTVENVEGIYQLRPRQSVSVETNHLYALEDPYGALMEGLEPETLYVGPSRYRFFESPDLSLKQPEWMKEYLHPTYFALPSVGAVVARYFGYDGRKQNTKRKQYDSARKSRYGYTWRGIIRPNDRELGIAGSELLVLDLQTNEVLGIHRGYAKFEIDERMGMSGYQWKNRCPTQPNANGGAPVEFILKVLRPTLQG